MTSNISDDPPIPSTDEENPASQKPLAIRLLHWGIVVLFTIAFATAFRTFDFDSEMRVWTRDALFATHRLTGLLAGLLLLVWFFIRLKDLFGAIANRRTFRFLGIFHIGFGLACFALPILPWIARSQEGRFAELYSLWPVFNFASHPPTDFVYKLLHQHKQLADIILILIVVHIAGALFHRFVLKDNVLRAMWFGKKRQ